MHTRIAQTNMSRTRITLALDPTAKKKTTYTHAQLFYIAFNAHYAAGHRTHAPNDPVYNGPRRACGGGSGAYLHIYTFIFIILLLFFFFAFNFVFILESDFKAATWFACQEYLTNRHIRFNTIHNKI